MTPEAKGSSVGLVVGAAFDSVVAGITGNWGQGLIFGALIGLVLETGVGIVASRKAETRQQ